MKYTTTLLICIITAFYSCSNSPAVLNKTKTASETSTTVTTILPGIKSGVYCSKVEYYNPRTNKRSTYNLEVEVENNTLVKINWPNGGWLDESHFDPAYINADGKASFTSDAGCEYKVDINHGSLCAELGTVVAVDNKSGEFLVKVDDWYIIAGRAYPPSGTVDVGDRFKGRPWEGDNSKIINLTTSEFEIWTIWLTSNSEKEAYYQFKAKCTTGQFDLSHKRDKQVSQ